MDSKSIRLPPVTGRKIQASTSNTMIRPTILHLLACLLVTGISLQATSSLAAPPEKKWASGRILVQPQAGLDINEFNTLLQRHGGRSKKRLAGPNIHIVEVPTHAEEAVAAALARNPRIEFAERDRLLPPDIVTANDPYYPNAWHLTTINAPEAWDTSFGNNVIVAILDTGVDASHPDLQGQLLSGWNAFDGNADTTDVDGHGTSVAGVVAARSNNAAGVTSIAWQAKIMPVRISRPDGWAYTSTIADGLIWAADHGARIANISYEVSDSATVSIAADYMRAQGGVVIASAGNGGDQLSLAPNPSIITVSATTSGDTKASWSNYGGVIDIAAPGSSIWSTKMGGSYGTVSGTSFSSPAVAAVAALVMASDPSLDPAGVEDILMNTSEDLGTPGQDDLYGHGRINAAAALSATGGSVTADGDLNTDGLVNAADVLIANRILAGQITLTTELRQRGDVAPLVNGIPESDGNFTTGDALVIQRKALGQAVF